MMTAQYCKVLQCQGGGGKILKIFFWADCKAVSLGWFNAGHHGVAKAREGQCACQ